MRFLLPLLFAAAGAFAQSPAAAPGPRPWPTEAVAESFDVRIISEDKASGATTYASPHFEMTSEVNLPVGVVRDLAAVFEATRVAVRTLPLGLQAAPEPKVYRVAFLANETSYAMSGGPPGSGGFYNGRYMVLLLPNLGITKTNSGLTLAHQPHLFVLKHEVTHQIIGPWNRHLPMWLAEGIAECMASTRYVRGRYTFTGHDSSMRDYLLKWRKTKDQRSLRLIPIKDLMEISSQQWKAQVGGKVAYDYYNSAALLVHWFLHHDGAGDAAGLAEYFDALRKGTPSEEAVNRHLLRGRTPEKIEAELRVLCRRLVLEIESP